MRPKRATTLAQLFAGDADSVLVPVKVPPALVQRMAAGIAKTMKNPANATQLEQQALLPAFDTPKQFAASLKEEPQNWAAFIRQHNVPQ